MYLASQSRRVYTIETRKLRDSGSGQRSSAAPARRQHGRHTPLHQRRNQTVQRGAQPIRRSRRSRRLLRPRRERGGGGGGGGGRGRDGRWILSPPPSGGCRRGSSCAAAAAHGTDTRMRIYRDFALAAAISGGGCGGGGRVHVRGVFKAGPVGKGSRRDAMDSHCRSTSLPAQANTEVLLTIPLCQQ
jgi:hypothetical protein